jgi:hypothetical protein
MVAQNAILDNSINIQSNAPHSGLALAPPPVEPVAATRTWTATNVVVVVSDTVDALV